MTTEEQAQPETGDSVGQLLRRQREERGLAVADVANELHLRPSLIQYIELGEYTRFDGELFLKGYVRSYAQLVGLDPVRLVAALDLELEPLRQEREKEQLANPLVDIERRRQRKRQIGRIVFVFVLLLLAGWLAYRFLIAADAEPVAEVSATAADDQAATEPVEVVADAAADVPPREPEPAAAAGTATVMLPASDTDTAAAAEVAAAAEETEAMTPAPAASAEASDTTPDPAGVIAGAGTAGDSPETETETAMAGPDTEVADSDPETVASALSNVLAEDQGRLVMSFSDQCWVQVSDSSGKRLTAALKGPGDILDVAGSAPLHVVIGAVDAVNTITFQNEPVDLARYRSVNNRTEFSLGP